MRAFYLLIGFLLMFQFPIPNTDITALPLLGFALMLFAMLRLEKMEPIFKKSKLMLLIALPISAALLGLQIFSTAGNDAVWFEAVHNTARMLTELCEISAMLFFYIGVKLIGTNADIPALEKQSVRNLTLMFVYFVISTVMNLLNIFVPAVFKGFEFVLIWPFIIGYLWRAMNIWTAFTLLTKVSASHE